MNSVWPVRNACRQNRQNEGVNIGQSGPGVSSEDRPSSEVSEVNRLVAAYVAVGADESVQRVIASVHRLSRRLNQWYDQKLADLNVSGGEWAVLSEIARADGNWLTPTQLADAAHVAPSSMTHRLDRMVDRDLVQRTPDPSKRNRILVALTPAGWRLYETAIREANLVEADLMRGLTARQVDDLAYLLEELLAGFDSAGSARRRAGARTTPAAPTPHQGVAEADQAQR